MASEKKLRLMTYMYPGYPLALYQTCQYYLEEAFGCDSVLMVESRQSGPVKGKPDPFTLDEADIGFLCSTSYLRLEKEGNQFVELLPVAPVFNHPKSEQRPVYFSEVVIAKEKASTIKEFSQLKGHKWAYNDEESLSGCLSTLAHLKKLGFNATFFGHTIQSGSHHNSIKMLLSNAVDVVTLDSNILQAYKTDHPEQAKNLHILKSLGPLPIPPVVVNSRLSDEMKSRLSQALLDMTKSEKWRAQLQVHNVLGFKSIDRSMYNMEEDILIGVKGQSVQPVYY